MDDPRDESRAKGGHARAESLSPEERTGIARRAALARWDAAIPQATHEGTLSIGGTVVAAAVLPNGKRLITQATFLRAIGRSRSPKGGTGVLATADSLPFFLQADTLKNFVSEELMEATTPIFFRTLSGKKGVGYDAQLLPKVADVYLKFRDACLQAGRAIPKQYEHIIRASDALIRGLASVGITALIDEATGYQEVRDRLALQAILDKFLRREFATWAKRFPDEFYREIFRLREWKWQGMKVNRPQVVAHFTKDIVYSRLAPGILKELEERNPKDDSGRRKTKHHQWLTEDVGHPALAQHLYAVIGLMRLSESWDEFKRLIDRAYPKRKDSAQLSLFND
jgi:P63C domain.